MNKEELKKLCKEEFLKNIKEYIKSETIFTYVDGLEKENNKQKEVLDKIKEIINNKAFFDPAMPNCNALGQKATLEILKLLEEIE